MHSFQAIHTSDQLNKISYMTPADQICWIVGLYANSTRQKISWTMKRQQMSCSSNTREDTQCRCYALPCMSPLLTFPSNMNKLISQYVRPYSRHRGLILCSFRLTWIPRRMLPTVWLIRIFVERSGSSERAMSSSAQKNRARLSITATCCCRPPAESAMQKCPLRKPALPFLWTGQSSILSCCL